MGLRQLTTKASHDTLSTFQEILKDIDDACDVTNSEKSKKILVNIVATMSDRAATENKFHSLVEALRAEVLLEVHENWNELSDTEKIETSRLLNFFCGLHTLVHFAETASAALLESDKGFFGEVAPIHDRSFKNSKEPGACRLARTSSRAFARGCDEKSGRFGEFNVFVEQFLKTHKYHSLPLEPYHKKSL